VTRPARQGGFTLLEVMIATAILALMMVIAWSATSGAIRTKRGYQATQERYREVRVAMNRIARDLSMAYVSANEDRNQLEPRTFFVGESSGDFDTLRFSAFAHTPLYADAPESDQAAVAYYGAADPEDRGKTNLMRRETRRPGNERWDALPGDADVVLRDVVKFECKYWNVQTREWTETWSTQNTDGGAPKVPDRVRFTVTFLDERGKETSFMSEERIHVQETLLFYAN